MKPKAFVLSVLMVLAAVALVTCNPLDPLIDGEPFAGYVPDPNIFVQPPDPAMLIDLATDDGGTITFAVNIVLTLMEEGATQADAEAVARDLGGAIVGQIPEIGLYQIQVGATTIAELDAAIESAEADPHVAHAGYDVAPTLAQECPADSDNREILQEDQCAFVQTEYFQAVTMFDIFRPNLALSRVTVGVVDTGLDPTTGEFDDIEILYLNSAGDPPSDRDAGLHGTGTCGLIAADDDGNGICGHASRMLGDRLSLVVGAEDGTASSSIAFTIIACAAGADVVNLSLGWEATHPRFDVIWLAWLRTMGRRGDVLFVVAAGNEQTELNGVNYAPGGIDLPNVLTVAATGDCEPDNLWIDSGYGAGVDIAAPGEQVPTLTTGGVYVMYNGTSLSTPIVASLAAVLKSIEPSLTPRQLARYITDESLPINSGTPFGRVTYPNSISQLLIDMNVGDPLQSWLDPLGLGESGASSITLSRICPEGISYRVDSYGAHELRSPGDDIGLGAIGSAAVPPTISIPGHTEDVTFTIGSSTLTEFALGSFPLMREPGPTSCSATFFENESLDGGHAIAGTLTIDSCRIEQRNPFNGVDPWVVVLNGAFEGVLEIGHFDGRDPTLHDFSGDFTMPMFVSDIEELHEYLEVSCEGGLPRDNGS